MKKNLFFLLVVLGWVSQGAMAQDAQFTQFYANPLYLNPAFTGNLDYVCDNPASRFRGIVNYRNQWSNFNTTSASVDYLFSRDKVGLGMIVVDDRPFQNGFRSTEIGLNVSYKLDLSQGWYFHSGLGASYILRNTNFSNYTLPDQFTNRGFTGQASREVLPGEQVALPNVNLGGLLFSKMMWLGVAAHHVNQPNQSLFGGDDPLAIRWSVHSGVKIPLNKKRSQLNDVKEVNLMPTVQFRRQGPINQLDMGCYFNYHPFITGLWYRGLPIETNRDGSINQDAFAALVGMKFNLGDYYFKLGYSYDLTVSKLGVSRGQAHEVTLSLQFLTPRCRQEVLRRGALPCPEF